MKRRVFALSVAGVLGGCTSKAQQQKQAKTPERTFDSYTTDSSLQLAFTGFKTWAKINVIADGQKQTATPENDLIAVVEITVRTIAPDAVELPKIEAFQLVSEGMDTFSPRVKLSGVPITRIVSPPGSSQLHPGDGMVQRPLERISPDRDYVRYVLVYDYSTQLETETASQPSKVYVRFTPESDDDSAAYLSYSGSSTN